MLGLKIKKNLEKEESKGVSKISFKVLQLGFSIFASNICSLFKGQTK